MEKHQFSVLIERDEDGMYVATAPALKGCHTQARSVEEILPRIKEAIQLCLEVEKEEKEKLGRMEFVGLQEVEVSV